MNLDMLQRIKDEGNSLCAGNNGLKGIEWAYNSTPNGPLDPYSTSVGRNSYRNNMSSEELEKAMVSNRMQELGEDAPKSFQFSQDAYVLAEPSAIYVCEDGSEYSSVNFRFVP